MEPAVTGLLPSLAPYGVVPLGVLVVLMVARGYLTPKRTVDAMREDFAQRSLELRTERDEYRQAWRAEIDRSTVRDAQFGELLELARTTDKILRSLPRPEVRPQ